MPRLKPKRRTRPQPHSEREPYAQPYSEPYPQQSPEPRRGWPIWLPFQLMRSLSLLGVGGAIVLAVIFGFGVLRAGENFLVNVQELFTAPQPEPEVDVRSVVVQQVREVSELSTAVFTMEAVVPSRRERTLAGVTVGATTLLYIARGEVRAGIDLSQLRPSDVVVDGEQLTIKLPPARILDQKIDVNRSSVYDYDRGFLNLGPDSAIELQSVANQAALDKIVTAACEQGILDQAGDRAQLVVQQLMDSTGQTAVVKTQPAIGCGTAGAIAPNAAAPDSAPTALPPQNLPTDSSATDSSATDSLSFD